jgi:hypothetical protein
MAACPSMDDSRRSGAPAGRWLRGLRSPFAQLSMNCATGLSAASADGFGLAAPKRACDARRAPLCGLPGAEEPRFEDRREVWTEVWCCS